MILSDGRMLNHNGNGNSVHVYPNPLSEDVKLEKYYKPASIATSQDKDVVFDGRYIWYKGSAAGINRFDPQSGETEVLKVAITDAPGMYFGGYPLVYDGKYIWSMQVHGFNIYKMDPETLEIFSVSLENYVNGNVNMFNNTSISIAAAGYNNENIWFHTRYMTTTVNKVPVTIPAKLIKINLNNGVSTGYDLPNGVGVVVKLMFTEKHIWLIGEPNYYFKFNLSTKEAIYANLPSNILPYGKSMFPSSIFDGKYIWLAPYGYQNYIVKINILTDEATTHLLMGENIGNCAAPTINCRFASMSFDGRYIWLAPSNVNRILRIDTTDFSMKGYDLIYPNSEAIQEKIDLFVATIFDGNNIWMLPGTGYDSIVKISSALLPNNYNVVEKYQTQEGTSLQADKVTNITTGNSYVGIAPAIHGYQYLGYKVDGGALQTAGTVNIAIVNNNHTIVFVYKKNETTNVKVTEKYLTTVATQLRPEQDTFITMGGDYNKTAPAISGYKYVGFRIDGGALQASANVDIFALSKDYVVTFVYEEVGSGSGSGGSCDCLQTILCPTEYTAGELIEVEHGLKIDAEKCFCDVRLKCVAPEVGYKVGEYITGFSIDVQEAGDPPAIATLTNDKISIAVGYANNGFLAITKFGTQFKPNPTKWRLVFRIWYKK